MKEGGILAGKYVLERQLARGGMGSVWRAKHVQLGTPVAIKFMDGALAAMPDLRTRFEREARAAAVLQIPNVVRIHDYGLDGGIPYIAMELLTGETLSMRLKRESRLSIPATARILSQVARALRRAHEAGIIHRDLKPQNIFLAREDDEEVVKVLDFGVAKMLMAEGNTSDTSTGMLLGSPSYMSPEQVRKSRAVDHRSDLWSLGVVAYRALTGRLPFPGDEVGDVIVRICTESVPRPSSIDPGLGLEVDTFFGRALARDPEQRYQSATELAAEFSRLAGRASIAGPPSPEGEATTSGPSLGSGSSLLPMTEGISNTPPAQAMSTSDGGGTLANATAGSDIRSVRATNRAGLVVIAASLATLAGAVGLVWALIGSRGGASSAHTDGAPAVAASSVPIVDEPRTAAAVAAPPIETVAPPAASSSPAPRASASASASASAVASDGPPTARAAPKPASPAAQAKPASPPQSHAQPPQAAQQGQPKKPSSVLGF